MALVLTEDETMLVDAARSLLSRSAPVSAFRALRDSGAPLRYLPGLWSEMAENGFVAPQVPEAEGGIGMGYTAAGLVAEQMGHVLAPVPFLSSALVAEALILAADEETRRPILAGLLDGSTLVAFAIDEHARHAPDSIETTATADGDGYRLQGTKRLVIDGAAAGQWLVVARIDGDMALLLADAGADGVAVTSLNLIDSRNAADITFSGAKARLIARGDKTRAAIDRALDVGRALIAAELLGIADASFDRTVDYLKEREQFGRKIGTFQALQHRAARLFARLDVARGVVLKALRALDDGDARAPALVALAKGVMGKLARDVLVETVQMHGGIGVTDELDVGFFFKRARAANDLLGDDYFQSDRFATLHLGL